MWFRLFALTMMLFYCFSLFLVPYDWRRSSTERRASQAVQCGMSGEFMKKVFEAIHEESVRQQMEILNK